MSIITSSATPFLLILAQCTVLHESSQQKHMYTFLSYIPHQVNQYHHQ